MIAYPVIVAWRLLEERRQSQAVQIGVASEGPVQQTLEVASAAYREALSSCSGIVEQMVTGISENPKSDPADYLATALEQIKELGGLGPLYDRGVPTRAAETLAGFDHWWRPPAIRLEMSIGPFGSAEAAECGVAAAKEIFDEQGVDPWEAQSAADIREHEMRMLSPEDGRRVAVWDRAQGAARNAVIKSLDGFDPGVELHVVRSER